MQITKTNQKGFHLVELVIAIAIIGLIGFIGWKVFSNKSDKDTGSASQSTAKPKDQAKAASFIEWSFDGQTWKAMGTAPKCEDQLTIAAPMDVSKATAVLFPGQIRGGDFKPHGGIGSGSATNNQITVSAVRDAYLYRGSRYIEQGETQYMFDFMDSCGVMYRFDHLATLSDEFKKYADLMPEAKVDDSRTTKFDEHPLIKKGTVVASEVGFKNTKNAFFDLGVYDLRQPNEASKTEIYKTDSMRISDKEQSFYAVCWFDLLPSTEKAIVKGLPLRGGDKESTSDYCK